MTERRDHHQNALRRVIGDRELGVDTGREILEGAGHLLGAGLARAHELRADEQRVGERVVELPVIGHLASVAVEK